MRDHHCLYAHGWIEDEWCDQCAMEYRAWRASWGKRHPGAPEAWARGVFETIVEEWCDEPLQLGPEPEVEVEVEASPTPESREPIHVRRSLMRITVSANRKLGLPNYGSTGASCEVSIEIDDRTTIGDQIRSAYALCNQAVEEQLARNMAVEHAAEEHPAPAHLMNGDGGAAADNGRSIAAYEANGRMQPRRPSLFETERRPRDGRQLYAWAKKMEEEGHDGLIKHLRAFGKREGYPEKLVAWDADQTNLAVAEAGRWSERN